MTIPTLTTLPVAPARTDPPATFVTRADAFLAAIVTFQGEMNTSIGAMNTDIGGIAADVALAEAAVVDAETAATNAESSASAAAITAGASLWVSGQSYDAGDAAISGIDYQTYRATTSTSGTTDPSLSGDWNIISFDGTITVSEISDLTATATEINTLDGFTGSTAELNYLDITTLGTTEASKAVTADANGVVTFDNGKIEESTAITSSSNAATINLRDGDNFTHTLSENVTYTFSNPAASGKVSAFTLKVTQDSTARTITWPSSVDWAGATAPTLTADSGGVDVFVFVTYDGGTNYYGFAAGQAMG